MHLVFLNQYYPPDAAPTGVMLEAVVEELAAQGHEVTVLCAEGGYAGGSPKTQDKEKDPPVAAVCDRRSECEVDSQRQFSGTDAHRAPLQADAQSPHSDAHRAPLHAHEAEAAPRVVRIGATRFGRGTILGKLIDYVSYYFGVAWRLWWMSPAPDRVVALTTPPLLSVMVRLITRIRKADHAHWVMDVYPDVMVAHGMVGEGSRSCRLLTRLARWGFGGDRCAAMVTLGPDMAERLARLSPSSARREIIRWVPLWGTPVEKTAREECAALTDPALALRRQRGWKDQDLVVMYSGNMGLGHRFGEILEVIRACKTGEASQSEGGEVESEDGGILSRSIGFDAHSAPLQDSVRFVFFGGGRRRSEIAKFISANPGCAVELHDYVGREQLAAHLRSADLHLVSLDSSWTGTMLPSKLQGIFAVARPVVFVGDTLSSLARWVEESCGGWVVRPGDVDGLRLAIHEARSPTTRTLRGRAALAFSESHFDRESNARQVVGWLTKGL